MKITCKETLIQREDLQWCAGGYVHLYQLTLYFEIDGKIQLLYSTMFDGDGGTRPPTEDEKRAARMQGWERFALWRQRREEKGEIST